MLVEGLRDVGGFLVVGFDEFLLDELCLVDSALGGVAGRQCQVVARTAVLFSFGVGFEDGPWVFVDLQGLVGGHWLDGGHRWVGVYTLRDIHVEMGHCCFVVVVLTFGGEGGDGGILDIVMVFLQFD